MKILKKALLIFLLLFLVGCEDIQDFKAVNDEILVPNETTQNIELKNEIKVNNKIYKLNWKSNMPTYLDNNGKVIRPHYYDGDKLVLLTVTISYRNHKASFTHEILIKAEELLIQTYEITFYDGEEILFVDTYEEGEEIKKPFEPFKEGYHFIGWFSDETLLNQYKFNERALKDESIYAKFVVTEIPPHTISHFNLIGFAENNVSIPNISETDPSYFKVYNELEFIQAIASENTQNTSSAKIIEIMNDLNLGYKEVINKYPIVATEYRRIFTSHREPSMHPTLIETGVSSIRIQNRHAKNETYGEGLMIFSKNNSTIKHASFSIKRSNNIIFRNLTLDELWEWDESGNYDLKDWDYFTVEEVCGIWFDHIILNKAYDGLIDFKYGNPGVTGATFSYLYLNFQPNNFIKDQLLYFEENGESPKYTALREAGMTIDEITALVSFQKKGFLLGGSELKPNITELTICNSWIVNLQDRFPRLRGDVNHEGGDVHIFNNYYDASDIAELKLDAKTKWEGILDTSSYRNMLTNQAIVSTENGAILVENTIFKGVTQIIKTNQTTKGELYTGKFLVLNSYYELYDYKFVGSSTDLNTPFKPTNSDSIIPFSFNAFDEIPYLYLDELIEVEVLENYLIQMMDTTQIDWLKTYQE